MKPNFCALFLSLMCVLSVSADEIATDVELQLTLPPAVYAVPGVTTSLFFDNLILTQSPATYQFRVTCDIGQTKERCWVVTPKPADAGEHKLVVAVHSGDGRLLATQSTVLHVVPASAGAEEGRKINILIIGDSLTHASAYPNEIARLLSLPGNPQWTMLGTHKPASAADGVVHEGYGGWTWERFVTHFEPGADGTVGKRSSPFVFLNDDGKPELNVPRYFDESCQGEHPDYVIIMLGINDCFSAPPGDVAAMDARINGMFGHADKLLSAVRHAAPEAQIGVCLTTPPNSRQEAFDANYKDRYSRWGWKRIQHRLVQRQIEYVTAKNDPQIHLIPTELNLDPVEGYPVNNGVHPNGVGYQQIGTTIYAWLKWQLSEPTSPPTASKTIGVSSASSR